MNDIANLWLSGLNTNEIAVRLGMDEPDVDKAVMRLVRQRAMQAGNDARLRELGRVEACAGVSVEDVW